MLLLGSITGLAAKLGMFAYSGHRSVNDLNSPVIDPSVTEMCKCIYDGSLKARVDSNLTHEIR